MKQNTFTTIDLVRHGEIATPDLLCAGHDEQLSARGRTQMERLISTISWDRVISSPMLRCSEFAHDLAGRFDKPFTIEPAFREIDFGAWTGITQQSIWETDKDRLLKLWSSPLEFSAPEGEAMTDFVNRVRSAFLLLLQTHSGKSILLVTHAGVIRAILADVLSIDYTSAQKFEIGYAKVNRLRAYPDGEFSLLNWNCHPSELV